MCTCPWDQALFDTGACQTEWLLQAVCVRSSAPLQAACKPASPLHPAPCNNHRVIYVSTFQPRGSYWLPLSSPTLPVLPVLVHYFAGVRCFREAEAAHFCTGTYKTMRKIKEGSEFPSLILYPACAFAWLVPCTSLQTEDLYIIQSKSQLEGCCIVFPVNLLLLHKTMSSSFCSSHQVCSEKG